MAGDVSTSGLGSSRRLRLASCLAALVGSLLLAGCGSSTIVDIDTKPTGATIYVNGEKKGTTRFEKLRLDFGGDVGQRVLIQLVLPGRRPVLQYWTLEEVPEKKVFPLEVD